MKYRKPAMQNTSRTSRTRWSNAWKAVRFDPMGVSHLNDLGEFLLPAMEVRIWEGMFSQHDHNVSVLQPDVTLKWSESQPLKQVISSVGRWIVPPSDQQKMSPSMIVSTFRWSSWKQNAQLLYMICNPFYWQVETFKWVSVQWRVLLRGLM